MPTTTISLRIDKKIKEQADSLFDELGLSLSAAINIFLRQSVRRQKIPFEIENTPFKNLPNSQTIQTIKTSKKNNANQKIHYSLPELFSAIDQEVANVK